MMLRLVAIVASLSVAASACTTTHRVSPGRPLPRDRSNHAMGALQGAGAGFLAGAAGGAVFGYAHGDDEPCGSQDLFCFSFSAKDKAVFGGVYGALAGGAVGLVVGGIIGKRDIYAYEDGPQLQITTGQGGATASAGWRF